MADTLGSLVDKLATVNNKLFVLQDEMYRIRKMSFREFYDEVYDDFDCTEGLRKLYESIKGLCDLNYQRSQLVTEFDREFARIILNVTGKDIADKSVIEQHKTY